MVKKLIDFESNEMKEFFEYFILGISSYIQRAIDKFNELHLPGKPVSSFSLADKPLLKFNLLQVIAFCGGGGMINFVCERLKAVFNDYKIILPPSPEQS